MLSFISSVIHLSIVGSDELAIIYAIYLPLTPRVPNDEKFMGKAFDKYSNCQKVVIFIHCCNTFDALPGGKVRLET